MTQSLTVRLPIHACSDCIWIFVEPRHGIDPLFLSRTDNIWVCNTRVRSCFVHLFNDVSPPTQMSKRVIALSLKMRMPLWGATPDLSLDSNLKASMWENVYKEFTCMAAAWMCEGRVILNCCKALSMFSSTPHWARLLPLKKEAVDPVGSLLHIIKDIILASDLFTTKTRHTALFWEV